ncbi:hypothetical protein [uncultured Ferrimonas sp.]|uniref:hypothetical protein n=1 Tax=uncultured Ferrimonas sp. TaxID=432640 RepID=UPI002618FA0E|nr:hypothetical protein [uncultured Ferrimonas sp.]
MNSSVIILLASITLLLLSRPKANGDHGLLPSYWRTPAVMLMAIASTLFYLQLDALAEQLLWLMANLIALPLLLMQLVVPLPMVPSSR